MTTISTHSLRLSEMLSPVLIFKGGDTKPERVDQGYTFPQGTLIYSNRLQWRDNAKGKGDKAFPFLTKTQKLLYAILP